MAPERCLLDTQGYKHTPRICNTYCLSVSKLRYNYDVYLALPADVRVTYFEQKKNCGLKGKGRSERETEAQADRQFIWMC
jgi:hypothetical protein